MKNRKAFSSYFNPSVSDIPLLYILYLISVPLAIILIKLKIKPNTITTFSNISALISFYFIFHEMNFFLFFFFWMFALFLDICDGIVSRNTNQQSANGSFYDHFTDQVKIMVLLLSVGIYFDTKEVWILAFLTSTLFLLYSLLNYMIKFRGKILAQYEQNNSTKSLVIKKKALVFLKKYFYNNIFIIQGNFVVYLGFLFLTGTTTYVFFILIFIISFNLLNGIRHMININNALMKKNLKWN